MLRALYLDLQLVLLSSFFITVLYKLFLLQIYRVIHFLLQYIVFIAFLIYFVEPSVIIIMGLESVSASEDVIGDLSGD